jgi:hypothetical protein
MFEHLKTVRLPERAGDRGELGIERLFGTD